jgi:hypothetical protein
MTENSGQLDPVERTLRDLQGAERAGVFRPTRVDARALLQEPARTGSTVFLLRRIAVAAVILVAVSVWGWGVMRQNTAAAVTFSDCVAGPSDTLVSGCDTYDYDADGDVDLADISSYQLAYAGTSH